MHTNQVQTKKITSIKNSSARTNNINLIVIVVLVQIK